MEWTQIVWGAAVASLILFESYFALARRFAQIPGGFFLAWLWTFYSMGVVRVFSLESDLALAWRKVVSMHTAEPGPYTERHAMLLANMLGILIVPHALDVVRMHFPSLYQRRLAWGLSCFSFFIFILLASEDVQKFVYEGL